MLARYTLQDKSIACKDSHFLWKIYMHFRKFSIQYTYSFMAISLFSYKDIDYERFKYFR